MFFFCAGKDKDKSAEKETKVEPKKGGAFLLPSQSYIVRVRGHISCYQSCFVHAIYSSCIGSLRPRSAFVFCVLRSFRLSCRQMFPDSVKDIQGIFEAT